MRFRPTQELCYLAGLAGRTREPERSQIGILTQDERIEEKFVQILLKLGVDPQKIIFEEKGSFRHIYAYHSKLAKMIREVMKERTTLPRKQGSLATAFVAGTFDANGHVTGNSITIRRLDKADELLLELLGIHSVNSRILSIQKLLALVKGTSVLAEDVNKKIF